jgi:hypothetical protein
MGIASTNLGTHLEAQADERNIQLNETAETNSTAHHWFNLLSESLTG